MKNKKVFSLTLLLISFFTYGCTKEISKPPLIKPIVFNRKFKKALWVVRFSIKEKKQIDNLIKFAVKNKIDILVVQIRGRGDAYYNSSYEPRAPGIKPDFDPLAYCLKLGKKHNIEIHAWVNMMYAADVNVRPIQTGHVLYNHPEWVAYDINDKKLITYSKKELLSNLVEGTFLDPGVPDVIGYTVNVVSDIAKKYDVNGIHFDFIRYPWSGFNGYYQKFLQDFGYNPEARMRFIERYGIDPVRISYKKAGTLRELWRQFRRDRINDLVKKCYYHIKKIRPSIKVSAAVIANAPVVRNAYFQDWKVWIKKGYLDAVFPMSYAQNMTDFKKYINIAKEIRNTLPVYMGVHIKKKTKVKLSAKQIKMIYDNGFSGFCIFSYKVGKNKIEIISKAIKENNTRITQR